MERGLIESREREQEEREHGTSPRSLEDFLGQKNLIHNLSVFIQAAHARDEALDHVLLAGPPGLGKTTLAHIIAREMHAQIKITSGPILSKAGDIAALLTNLGKGDVLFIDEIHRLLPAVEEILYPAMSEGKLDLTLGEGPGARSVRIDLPSFTLIGATTRVGLLTRPLQDRFSIPLRFSFYDQETLCTIVETYAKALGFPLDRACAQEVAARSRGTPRIAKRLLRRVRDFCAPQGGEGDLSIESVRAALSRLEVDDKGLDAFDHLYLRTLAFQFQGGPVGINTLSAALNEPRDALEDLVEPYLIQVGFVVRTKRGRMIQQDALKHLEHKLTSESCVEKDNASA